MLQDESSQVKSRRDEPIWDETKWAKLSQAETRWAKSNQDVLYLDLQVFTGGNKN